MEATAGQNREGQGPGHERAQLARKHGPGGSHSQATLDSEKAARRAGRNMSYSRRMTNHLESQEVQQ